MVSSSVYDCCSCLYVCMYASVVTTTYDDDVLGNLAASSFTDMMPVSKQLV